MGEGLGRRLATNLGCPHRADPAVILEGRKVGLTSEARAWRGRGSRGTGRRAPGPVPVTLMALTVLSVICVVWAPSRVASATSVGALGAPTPDLVSIPEVVAPTHAAASASPAKIWTTNGAKATSVVTAKFSGTTGKAVAGVPVHWAASVGSLSASTGTTAANGEARVTLTQPVDVSPSKAVTVTATDADDSTVRSSTSVTFFPNKISFLPLAASAGPWEWYGSCEFVPSAMIPPTAKSGCRSSDPTFGSMVVNGDLWNLSSTASGHVAMQINAKGQLATTEGFVSAPELSPLTWVLGDPNVSYGVEPQAPADPPKVSASLPLPMALDALPRDVVASAAYDLTDTASVTYDFSYDLWLEPQKSVVTPTKGTIELMIWMDDGNSALPSGHEGTVSMNDAVNGVDQSAHWGLYINNGDKAAAAQTTVYLVLQKPTNDTRVSVDFNSAFAVMEAALKKYDPTHWSSFSSYYLDSIPLGSEFGRQAGKSQTGPSHWLLENYYLTLGKKLP